MGIPIQRLTECCTLCQDKDCSGVIDYMNFISSAMFYSPFGSDAENAPPPKPKKIAKKPDPVEANPELYHVPDIDESELRAMQSAELKRMFLKVDKLNTGNVDKDQFE